MGSEEGRINHREVRKERKGIRRHSPHSEPHLRVSFVCGFTVRSARMASVVFRGFPGILEENNALRPNPDGVVIT